MHYCGVHIAFCGVHITDVIFLTRVKMKSKNEEKGIVESMCQTLNEYEIVFRYMSFLD